MVLLLFSSKLVSYCQTVKTPIRRPFIRPRPVIPADEAAPAEGSGTAKDAAPGNTPTGPSWRHDLLVGLISGAVVAAATMIGQAIVDDRRSDREARLENLRFVRERSSEDRTPRPFRGMDLREQNLSGLSLAGANLDEALLDYGNFANTNLQEAQMVGAKIRGGRFGGTNLKAAGLSFVDLSGATMLESDMSGAQLAYTDLSGAILSGVELQNASLRYTRLNGTDLRDVDLTGVDMSLVCYDDATKWPASYVVPELDVDQCGAGWPVLQPQGAGRRPAPPV